MEVITLTSEAFQKILKTLEEIKQNQSKSKTNEEKKFLTNKEVANLLGCSIRSLQSYRDSGELAYIKFGKKLLYKMKDIESFLNDNYREKF